MKKKIILYVLFMLCMAMSLSGCGTSRPENIVKKCFESMRKNEISQLSQYTVENTETGSEVENSTEDESYVISVVRTYAEKHANEIEYKIKSSEVLEDTATVTVEVTYNNAAPVIKLALTDVFNKALESALSGIQFDDEEMAAIFTASFQNEQESAAIVSKTETIDIKCKKVHKTWKVVDVGKLTNIYFCNMYSALDEYYGNDTDNIDDDVKSEGEEESDDTEGTDITKTYDGESDFEEYTVEYTFWTEYTDITITMNYQSSASGTYKMRYIECDDDGSTMDETSEGTFNEDSTLNGTLYNDNGDTLSYTIYYDTDHYCMTLYDDDGSTIDLLEKEWAQTHVG